MLGFKQKTATIEELYDAVEQTGTMDKARKELGWSKKSLKTLVDQYRYPVDGHVVARGKSFANGGALSASLAQEIDKFVEAAIPSTLDEKLALVRKYSSENDLIGSFSFIKSMIASAGFKVFSQEEEDTNAIIKFNKSYKIESVISQMFFHAFSYDNMGLVWNKSNNGLRFRYPVDPYLFRIMPHLDSNGDQLYKHGLPQKEVFHSKDQELLREVNRFKPGNKQITGVHARNRFNPWNEATNGRIETRSFKGHTDKFIAPRMQEIFFELALRATVKEGNMSTFRHMKRILMLIKIGAINKNDDKFSFLKPLAELTREQADRWIDSFKDYGKTSMAAIPDYVDVDFAAPDIEYLKLQNFSAADMAIIRWSGLEALFGMPVESGKYADSYQKMKRLTVEIFHWRTLVGDILKDMYADVMDLTGEIDIVWDPFILMEPKTILDRVKFAYQELGLAPELVFSALSFNHDMSVALNIKTKNRFAYMPRFESRQGILKAIIMDVFGLEDKKNDPTPGEPGAPHDGGPDDGEQPKPSNA